MTTDPTREEPPRRPRLLREPIVLSLLLIGAGLLVVWLHHPRRGLYLCSAGLYAGALLRLLLTPRDAGLLVVRSRLLDVLGLLVLASGVLGLALVTPFPAAGG